MGRLEKIESFGVLMAPLNLSLITQQPTEGFYDSKVFSPEALPLRTFLPVHYEPNYAYPLIVYLHAHGSNEEQVLRYAPHISRRNYISISLRGMHATMVKKTSSTKMHTLGALMVPTMPWLKITFSMPSKNPRLLQHQLKQNFSCRLL